MEVTLNKKQVSNRVRWVKALLSGDFRQGHGALVQRNDDNSLSYCCLGVACQLVAPRATELKFYIGVNSAGGYMHDRRAAKRFGLDYEEQRAAARWNDTKRTSFSRIADLVAYATDKGMRFDTLYDTRWVPKGFAVEWLKEFES